MDVRDLLKAFFQSGSDGPPVVATDEAGVHCTWGDGTEETIAWDDLCSVVIRTTDGGPMADDFFFILSGEKRRCVIPQDAEGSEDLLARLQRLPGFDNEAVIAASGSVENAEFVCWTRDKG